MARNCSLTRLTEATTSPSPGSSRTGYTLVNQPTVRDSSAPGTRCSTRPCPSTSTRTEDTPRHRRTARLSAVSSTSSTPACNAAGTDDSSGAVTSRGRVSASWPTAAATPVNSPATRSRSPASTSSHSGSCAVVPGAVAAAASPSAQVRYEVPVGARATDRQASRRSGSRIRHETPSTARWWSTTSSRPVPPVSSHTTRRRSPATGSSSSAAIRAWSRIASCTVRSSATTRRTHAATSSDPGAATRIRHPSRPGTSRARSAACRSTTAASPVTSASRPSSGGTVSTTAWCARANCSGVHSSANRATTGGAGSTPTPVSSVDRAGAEVPATAANSATVCFSRTSRGEMAKPAARARLTRRIATMLSPPRSKKRSCTPIAGTPSTSANNPHSSSSTGVPGGREDTVHSGAGSARRSSFPLRVRGSASSVTNADGTMYPGRVRATWSRTRSASPAASVPATR